MSLRTANRATYAYRSPRVCCLSASFAPRIGATHAEREVLPIARQTGSDVEPGKSPADYFAAVGPLPSRQCIARGAPRRTFDGDRVAVLPVDWLSSAYRALPIGLRALAGSLAVSSDSGMIGPKIRLANMYTNLSVG